jgi:hypothetical protein
VLQRVGKGKCAAPGCAGDNPLFDAQVLPDRLDVLNQGLGCVFVQVVEVFVGRRSAAAAAALVQSYCAEAARFVAFPVAALAE